jgi:hypothetical protein
MDKVTFDANPWGPVPLDYTLTAQNQAAAIAAVADGLTRAGIPADCIAAGVWDAAELTRILAEEF